VQASPNGKATSEPTLKRFFTVRMRVAPELQSHVDSNGHKDLGVAFGHGMPCPY